MNHQFLQSRPCVECGRDYPLSKEYYNRDNNSPDGFRAVCKLCRAGVAKEAMDAKLAEKIKQLDDQSLEALDRVADKGSDTPHIAEAYNCIMDLFGGAPGYAERLKAQYLAAPPGSFLRTRMLELIYKMSKEVTTTGMATVTHEMLTTEELEKMHQDMIEGMTKKLRVQQPEPPKLTSDDSEIEDQEYTDEEESES